MLELAANWIRLLLKTQTMIYHAIQRVENLMFYYLPVRDTLP